jgi:hypothetical protein
MKERGYPAGQAVADAAEKGWMTGDFQRKALRLIYDDDEVIEPLSSR